MPRTAPAAPSAATAAVGPALVVAVVSGGVISLQGTLNGELNTSGAGPLVATWFSYAGTLVTVLVVLAVVGRLGATVRTLRTQGSWWWFAIGLCSVPLVLSMALGIPVIGVALASVCAVAGQTISGLLLDSRGVGVSAPLPLTARRAVAGVGALLGLTVAVVASPDSGDGTLVAAVLMGAFLFVGGLLLAVQQAGNGIVTGVTGDPLVPTVASVTGGLAGVTLVTAAVAAFGGLSDVALPAVSASWWVYLGGPLGMIVTAAAAYSVRRLGTFALTLAVVGGQLVVAVVIDLVVGIGATWATAVSLSIIAASVTLTALPERGARTARSVTQD